MMKLTKQKVLLFTKVTPWCKKVVEFCKRNFDTTHYMGNRGDAKDWEWLTVNLDKEFDYIISYLSPWILPASILKRAK